MCVEVKSCASLLLPRELARPSSFIASRNSSVTTFFWILFNLWEILVKILVKKGGCRIMRADFIRKAVC